MSFPHDHHYLSQDERILENARRSGWVLSLTAFMMVIEIIGGYLTRSMALFADGWHMASHAGAMLISLLAYRLGRSRAVSQQLSFGAGKFIPLGGYSSALILAIISVLMAAESVQRLFRPETIQFNEAIAVASAGLVVNLLSAWILDAGENHPHQHEHPWGAEADEDHDPQYHDPHDPNLRSAYIHVLADALTSILAIVALTFGKFYGFWWMDPAMGIIGSVVILRWASGLCRDTASELLDVHSRQAPPESLKRVLVQAGIEVLDVHSWRIAPGVVACELVVAVRELRGGDFYRSVLQERFPIEHLTIEERLCP